MRTLYGYDLRKALWLPAGLPSGWAPVNPAVIVFKGYATFDRQREGTGVNFYAVAEKPGSTLYRYLRLLPNGEPEVDHSSSLPDSCRPLHENALEAVRRLLKLDVNFLSMKFTEKDLHETDKSLS